MPEAWDTTTAARLRPNSEMFEYAILRWRAGDPIALTASTFNEISYGLHKATAAGRAAASVQLRWLREQITAGLLDILVFDERAADIAGALRAQMPIPPPAAKRGHRRSKADNRVAWIMDLQTAATVFAHGYDLVSADAHLPLIAAQLCALAPDVPALLIHAPPSEFR
jgi:predicted nucleic acid-binding protein